VAKRTNGSVIWLIVILTVIGLAIVVGATTVGAFGVLTALASVGGVILMIVIARLAAKRWRRAALVAKYGDPQIVERIMTKTIWVGQTSEQLRESLGEPPDIDEKVLKTKKKQTWKYGHKGGDRYALRITVEDDAVAGWDER